MRIVRATWTIAILIMLLAAHFPEIVGAQDSKSAQSANAVISLTISAVADTVKAGFPVLVDAILANKSNQDISEYKENTVDQGGFVYQARVWDHRTLLLPETRFAVQARGEFPPDTARHEHYVILRSGAFVTLKPGKRMTDRVDVGKLCDLSQSGKYTIQLRRFDDESKSFVESNKITVTVTP
jgi:hypothetical protein